MQIDEQKFHNSLKAILQLFEYDTFELIDLVLTDDEKEPEFSPNTALNRLQHIVTVRNYYDSQHYEGVCDYLSSHNYSQEDIDTLLQLAQKEKGQSANQ